MLGFGQWLTNKSEIEIIKERSQELKTKGSLQVIVADNAFKNELELIYSPIFNFGCYHLNWWEHNRHFTICLDSGVPISCIHFSRRLRSQDITPLFLESKDAEKVLEIFCMYMEKTKNNESRKVKYSKDTKRYISDLCGA